jgi:hypothetical protein
MHSNAMNIIQLTVLLIINRYFYYHYWSIYCFISIPDTFPLINNTLHYLSPTPHALTLDMRTLYTSKRKRTVPTVKPD